MGLLAVFLTALLGVAPTLSNPVLSESRSTIEARNNIQVFVCDSTNWGGHCENLYDPEVTCYQLDNGQGFYKNVASFGPEKGVFCQIYYDNNCVNEMPETNVGLPGFITYPGLSSLGSDNWQMGSFFCQNGPAPKA